MPLLPAEPSLYPTDFFERPLGEFAAARWWVLHTRPRAEKCVARSLRRLDVPFYLPLCRKQWRRGGRVLQSFVPLFPGYVFLHGDGQARLAALATNRIAHCIPVEDQQRLDEDLRRVQRLIDSGEPLTPEGRLVPGTHVRITSGALAGLRGIIRRRGNRLTFIVEVNFLQRGVSMEVEEWMVEPELDVAD